MFVNDATLNTLRQLGINDTLVGLGVGAKFWDAINRLKTGSTNPEFLEDYQELVKEWKRDDDNVKDKRDEMQSMNINCIYKKDKEKHRIE